MGLGGNRHLEGALPGMEAREHPLAHQTAQVRRGYNIAKQAAVDLDSKDHILDWRSDMAGAGAKYKIGATTATERKSEIRHSGDVDELSNPKKKSDHGPCLPIYLANSYVSLREALERAQHQAMRVAPARWYELQRADELTRFLTRADVSVLSKEEVGDLGEALRHVSIAQTNARTNDTMPLTKAQKDVPLPLEGALQNAYMYAKATAAHGYRCRDNEFLPPLLPVQEEEEEVDVETNTRCSVM